MDSDLDSVKVIIARPEHRDAILYLAEHFYIKNEPVRMAMNVQWEDARVAWEQLADECLKHPHSHVAINSKGEMVAFRMSRIVELSQFEPGDSINDFLAHGLVRRIEDLLTENWAGIFVDEKGERSKKAVQFLSLLVHPNYGGRGLAVDMCRQNLALAKELGCEWASVVASNWMSQRVFEKLGFVTKATINFEKLKDDNGHVLFKPNDPKQIGSKWQVKKL